ncbi:WD40-repeat-containing domain protein [Suillus lakei]|nr:WD40-repeat-containing domain protein [Suillus lakei]
MLLGVLQEAHPTARGSAALARMTQGQPAPTRTMRSHTEPLLAVAFFKDGRRVVTGSHDKTLRICDMQKGSLVGGPFEGHKDYIRSVAVSPDDKRIASSGDDKTIIIWDVESKQMVFDPLEKHTGWVLSVCFSPDGKRLASGSHDKTVVVWDAETGAVLATLEDHCNSVWSVVFSPDGLKLASGSADHSIRVWRADNAELLLEINAHQHWVRSVVWSPDGEQLVSASFDKTVKFWDSSNGDQIGQPCTSHTYHALAISSDGSYIATASDDKILRLWSTKTRKLIGQLLEHTVWVRCVAISPNGELLVSGDGEGRVMLCSIKNILEQHNAEERATDDEEAQQQQLPFSDTQLRDHESNEEFLGNHGSPSNHASEIDETSSIGDEQSLFDILAVQATLRDASITGTLHTAEELLTGEIDADDNNYESYANRSVVRARHSEWKNALQDAAKSIAIQPSLLGYISMGIALCGNEQLWDAMEAFDLAFIFYNRNPIIVDLLLLIKAVALFNASRRDEAMRRVQDLVTAYQHPDRFPCGVVNSYLHQLTTSISGLFLHTTFLEPRLQIFTVLFGWDLDSLWETINQRRCDAFLLAGRVTEAVESFQYMMSIIDEAGKDSCLEWSTSLQARLHCVLCREGTRG